MASYDSSYLIIVSAAIPLFIHPASGETTQDLIDIVCRQTEDYGFCNQIFHQYLKSPVTDMIGLAQITVEQSLELSTLTRNFIAYNLLPMAATPGAKKLLYDCKASYEKVMSYFQFAAIAFFSKKYEAVYRMEQMAPRALVGCIVEPPPPYPFNKLVGLKKQMRVLLSMAVICGKDIAHSRTLLFFIYVC
ncbi:hypothetical protein L6164_026572 [Bauhinia variegata]|uniref:Uncharacterized protein n=1 Tax=Bauhinia variegata TaxID=167791 RepID=A0ACB9LS46_BAUVA|nr:hypothetical protein L6164_026572 [Bauhinia variegata]